MIVVLTASDKNVSGLDNFINKTELTNFNQYFQLPAGSMTDISRRTVHIMLNDFRQLTLVDPNKHFKKKVNDVRTTFEFIQQTKCPLILNVQF